MSLTEETKSVDTTSSANNANNSFHININTEKALPPIQQPIQQPYEKALPGYAQSVQQPIQQPYSIQNPTQHPYQPPANINNTVSPTINPVITIHNNSNAPSTGYVCPHCSSTLNPITNY